MLIKEIENPKIAVFGATYKGNVDDIRESPALEIISLLKNEGMNIAVHDSHVARADFVTLEQAVENADLILVLVDHNEYKELPHRELAKKMRHSVLFDTKNIVKEQPGSGLEIINYGNIYQYKK